MFLDPTETFAVPREPQDGFALSHAQRGVWLDAKMIGRPQAYQIGSLAEIAGPVDPALAQEALRLVMSRHDALRLRIDADEPRQRFEPLDTAPFHLIDLSGVAEPDAAAAAHLSAIQAAGFPLGPAPLFRLDLLKLAPDRWHLILLAHHLIADGVSIALAQRHWLEAYNRLFAGEEAGGTEARSSYAPVVAEDAAYEASARHGEDLDYWAKRLSPRPGLVFENRPAPQGHAPFDGAPRAGLLVAPETAARFEAAARTAGTTLHRALVATLALALSRRYDRTDLALGMALHRREHATRDTIGMLAGMIAVRCAADPACTLLANVQRIAADLDADLRRQRAPIDAIGRRLAAEAGSAEAGRGLFDVAVTIMPAAAGALPALGGGATIRSRPIRAPEETPLAVYINELAGGGLSVQFGFNPDILASEEVERLEAGFRDMLEAFAARPERRLSALPRLTREEDAAIAEWSEGTALDVPQATLHGLFQARAAEDPDAPALLSDEGAMSYGELDRAATALAARLGQAGIAPGSVVGVLVERSMTSSLAAMAILKAGCVYLPLDPVYPDERLHGMIEDAQARAVLTTGEGAGRVPDGVMAIGLGAIELGTAGLGATDPAADHPPVDDGARSPEDLAYIVFTSGSTGRPKGVAMSHGAAVNLAFARQEHDPIGRGDRVLAAISVGFDVSIGQLLLPLLSGAAVVVAGEIRGLSPEAFWAFMVRHGVTHVNSVPSFLESVLPGTPGSTALKQVMLGGEGLSGALAAKLRTALGVPVVNMYGPTETCIDATAFPVPASGFEAAPILPIGRPLPNYATHVLDAALKPVAIGAEGELFIGGAGLAEGYLGPRALTQERFVETPLQGRLYRTGDRALWREDGQIAFLGRTDAQVKIRGFRVEPGEIEVVLRGHQALAQAAVVARPDARGAMRLLAYGVPAEGAAPPGVEALRAHLAARLPAHMVPAEILLVDALPLTPNGKLDARALPEPGARAGTGRAPETATERLLAESYAALLGVAGVDVEAHFFELGGHSLLATQLASRLRAALGVELPIRTLFETPRILDLAPRIDALLAEGGARPAAGAPLVARPRPARLPLSHAQERLWFLDRLERDSPAYNIPTALRLDGDLDAGALEAAFAALVERHEILRTRFAEIDGAPAQIVMDTRAVPFALEDLTGGREAETVALLEAEARRPFDLERDPLLRVRLLRLAPQAHVCLLTLHHIVSDGWSSSILVTELAALYEAARAGRPAGLAPLAIQFADFALWQREALGEAELAGQTAFWREALAGAPDALTLPLEHPRPATRSFIGRSQSVALPADVSQALVQFAHLSGATPFIVLLSAFAALLSRWSGQEDVVIGAPIANRRQAETEGLIGFFVNTIALRADLSGAPSLAELTERMRARSLDAYAHQDLPFERLVDALKPARDPGLHPVFQTMFVLQNAPEGRYETGSLAISPVVQPESVAKFDLTLTLSETPDGFAGALTYAADLFSPALVARMAAEFERLVRAALEDPGRDLAAIPLVSEDEELRLIAEGEGIRRPVAVDTVPALFEAEVRRRPGGEAVAHGATRLDFAALNARANRLAHALIAAGIGPERTVGVILPRSEALVVAALAILKAGGVYVPLDPAYPAERIAAILATAAPALVLAAPETRGALPEGTAVLDLAAFDGAAFPDRDPTDRDRTAPLSAENLAYVIHTSGSTGRPKGVAVSHGALVHLADARKAHDPIGPGDRVLAALSIGFDVSVGQLVTPLLSGATVVVSPDLGTLGGAGFWSLLEAERITHLNAGPAFLGAALDAAPPKLSLKRLMLGGEGFSTALARRLLAALPGTEVFNMYGPTEACIDATAYRATGQETGAFLPIGRPLPNYRVHLLDAALRPVAPGLAGEIHIGGPTLARSYVGDPAETEARFVADPFGAPGDRLYRTGDLARRNAAGEIEFLGRIDAQVKIRGVRIELGEIEAVLRRHPAVAAVAAVARPHRGELAIVAYVVPSRPQGEALRPAELRDVVALSLPHHMVPAAILAVPALPMTAHGKLDLRALPEPLFEEEARDATPPRNALDEALRDVWISVLGLEALGLEENFFRIGGHSLMALRVAAAVKARLGLDMPVGALFRNQTIRQLSDALSAGACGSTSGSPAIALNGHAGDRPVFAVHAVGGSALVYSGLAQALADARPVFGLQASGLDAGEPLAPSLEAMAQSYVAALRGCQPQGPYTLLGHSFGGLVAFEMTRQLEAAGERVERLVMLDTSSPATEGSLMPPAEQARMLLAAESSGLGLDIEEGARSRIEAVIANNVALAAAHAPGRIEAPLTYVEAMRHEGDADRAAYWLARSLRPTPAARSACGHFDMLRPEHLGPVLAALSPADEAPETPVSDGLFSGPFDRLPPGNGEEAADLQ
ncbi:MULTISPECIES: amino acid adenylation domain-containing protein [unclassified Aureimonas]|uniref:amino acid adenylation domain-containing protein n=1 Tax=unclassified Aureimonas TaxID=2615206 RepID=UPI0006FE2184|nr:MULTISPECIES: non-ribosomal peptide synthetase [unclassified Aureimonas]KQT68984.1 hypothetical protein ASG54_04825 [Aureimonas sp. Leaf460]KQT69215.1 hypothetical protein ASG62_17430 [Aureimonas sp. Leaf427]